MTNTIPNVPRELLADLLGNDHDKRIMAERHLLAMLANAPSPAGVDGLEVYITDCATCVDVVPAKTVTDAKVVLAKDAQAIIDGLRGEVEALQSMITDLSKTGIRMRAERDNQARRAGELAAALEFACKSLAQVTSSDGSGHADIAVSVLRMAGRKEADASQIVEAYKAGAKWRIDAALSAGKERE